MAATAGGISGWITLMVSPRKFVFVSCLCALWFTIGCDQFTHKKKPATLPPRAQAPTIPLSLPDKIPEPTIEPPKVVVADEAPKPPENKQAAKPHRHNNATKKTASGATPGTSPSGVSGTTTIVASRPPEPPAPSPNGAIAADLSTDKADKDKQTTAEFLDSAEKILKGLDDHNLTDDQKAMVSQISSFIAQSRKATSDGDVERALNLATKAHLLSDALETK